MTSHAAPTNVAGKTDIGPGVDKGIIWNGPSMGVLNMQSELAQHQDPVARRKGGAGIEYWLIFAACFVVFLPVTVVERLVPQQWRRSRRGPKVSSIISEAWGTAHRCTSLAFSG
jgi:hypothetical protein